MSERYWDYAQGKHVKQGGTNEAGYVVDGSMTPVGFGQDDSIPASVGLPSVGINQGNTPPATARIAIIQVTGAGLYWTDDGATVPSSTNGMYLAAGDSFLYTGDITAVRIIEESTDTVVRVSYYA